MTKETGVVAHVFNPNTRVLPLASHCTWKSWPHDSLTCSTSTEVGAGERVFPLNDHHPQECWPCALQITTYKNSCLASHQELQGILGSGTGGAFPTSPGVGKSWPCPELGRGLVETHADQLSYHTGPDPGPSF